MAAKQLPSQQTRSVTLASGASGSTIPVECLNATAVHIAATCDVVHQLTAANVVLTMSDGKRITVTPGTYPSGTDATGALVRVMGAIITLDLSAATHRGIVVSAGAASLQAVPIPMPGVQSVHLALTKAATAGDAVYTFTFTVYRP